MSFLIVMTSGIWNLDTLKYCILSLSIVSYEKGCCLLYVGCQTPILHRGKIGNMLQCIYCGIFKE